MEIYIYGKSLNDNVFSVPTNLVKKPKLLLGTRKHVIRHLKTLLDQTKTFLNNARSFIPTSYNRDATLAKSHGYSSDRDEQVLLGEKSKTDINHSLNEKRDKNLKELVEKRLSKIFKQAVKDENYTKKLTEGFRNLLQPFLGSQNDGSSRLLFEVIKSLKNKVETTNPPLTYEDLTSLLNNLLHNIYGNNLLQSNSDFLIKIQTEINRFNVNQ